MKIKIPTTEQLKVMWSQAGVGAEQLTDVLSDTYEDFLAAHNYVEDEETTRRRKAKTAGYTPEDTNIPVHQLIKDFSNTWSAFSDVNMGAASGVAKSSLTGHYDNFDYFLTQEDHDNGSVRMDPYQVADIWKFNDYDNTGCLFHILKTISRFGRKDENTTLRELESIEATIKRKIALHKASM